jgi:hypothetical protein
MYLLSHVTHFRGRIQNTNNTNYQPARGSAATGPGEGPGWTTCVTELPSTPQFKPQSSITNPHSETGHFHIKSMPICGKFGAASTAGWGAGAAIFSPVGREVLLHPVPRSKLVIGNNKNRSKKQSRSKTGTEQPH